MGQTENSYLIDIHISTHGHRETCTHTNTHIHIPTPSSLPDDFLQLHQKPAWVWGNYHPLPTTSGVDGQRPQLPVLWWVILVPQMIPSGAGPDAHGGNQLDRFFF